MAHAKQWSATVATALTIATIATACGGGRGSKTPSKANAADAGAEGGGPKLSTSPPPSGLPPMASMPPPGVAGSKKAKLRLDAALGACDGVAKGASKDPGERVKKLGESCAGASKMKATSAVLRGQQGDKDAHQEQKFRAEANHCYRVYFASDDAVKDIVLVLRDSAGDIVAEAPGPALPENGAVCFTTSDEVSMLVAVGNGKGAWAAQVWGD
jgi:hypothetical protein